MEPIFFLAGIWLLIAVLAAIVAYHLDISIALVEICVGVAAGAIADHFFGKGSLGFLSIAAYHDSLSFRMIDENNMLLHQATIKK